MNDEIKDATSNGLTSKDLKKLIDLPSIIKMLKEKRTSVNDIMLLGLASQMDTIEATNKLTIEAIESSKRIAKWTRFLAWATFALALATVATILFN